MNKNFPRCQRKNEFNCECVRLLKHMLIIWSLFVLCTCFAQDLRTCLEINTCTNHSTMSSKYTQDGPEAQKIASVIPYYPFHGVPRFYDISGMLGDPEVFKLTIDIFVERYASLDVDCVAGLDARGFVLGPPIALALKKPFIMIRKKGKLPNAVSGSQYYKEYKGDNTHGGDELSLPRTAIKPGARVLVIDDLVATGGTLIAACDLLSSVGFTIVECACVVELKALGGYHKLQAKHPTVNVWGLISEDILTLEGKIESEGSDSK